MIVRSTSVLATVMLLAACQGGPMSDARRNDVTNSVTAAHQALFTAVASRNADSVMTFFVNDDRLVWAQTGMVFPSRDSVVKTARAYMGGARSIVATPAEPRIMVLGPDAAVLTTTFNETFTDTTGHAQHITAGWTAVYHREAAGWKIVHVHESLPLAASAPTPSTRRRS